jgi:uncharacterized membrane protein YphA (DoxX/SURF4 family)
MRISQIGLLTMVMLVALRLVIGWHFYKSGVAKYVDPGFSSQGFLSQAKGPLADRYTAVLEDWNFHEWDERMAQPSESRPLSTEEVAKRDKFFADRSAAAKKANEAGERPELVLYEDAPYKAWADVVARDWRDQTQQFIGAHDLTKEQEEAVGDIYYNRKKQLFDYLEENDEAVADYRHELWRVEKLENSASTGELPFHDQRIAQLKSKATGLGMPIRSDVQQFGAALYADLEGVLDQEQRAGIVVEATPLKNIDTAVTWLTMIVGGCLIVGLFTRLAAVAGGVFLISVIGTQPPWVPGAAETYSQFVEMFALFALATTAVGRWGGLDFFIHAAFSKCCSSAGE